MTGDGPLDGITVLDFTTNVSGPVATHVLSSLGAAVWKVERPDGGDDARQMAPVVGGDSAYFIAINSSKKSVALNLGEPRAKEVVEKLVRRADVLVENYRPGVADRLGVGWSAMTSINDRLVYASISGYGGKGPDGFRAGYDALLQARTGLLSVTGHPRQAPARIGVSILDVSSGVWTALGIVTALMDRDRTKKGSRISTSLLENGVFLFGYHLLSYQLTGRLPGAYGTEHPAFSPYGYFATARSDGIFIGVSNDRQFARLCICLGHGEWAVDPRYMTNVGRVKNRERLHGLLESALRGHDAAWWESKLTDSDVPVSLLQNARDVLNDVQAEPLSLFQKVEGPAGRLLSVPRIPMRFSGIPSPNATSRPPRLGQHTREVLLSVGFTGSQLEKLERIGVIAQYSKKERLGRKRSG
ncbi:MAG: CoA transferase [Thaumarchaeota archaeon]|nr:CoA transferase [Nitrososphaerota archaeon]